MSTSYPRPEQSNRDEPPAFAYWLARDLHDRFPQPRDLTPDLLRLVDEACTQN